MVHWLQRLKTNQGEFEKDMVHERISVTVWRTEFLSWRDTELLFSNSKTRYNTQNQK